jgi:hypothetical protein
MLAFIRVGNCTAMIFIGVFPAGKSAAGYWRYAAAGDVCPLLRAELPPALSASKLTAKSNAAGNRALLTLPPCTICTAARLGVAASLVQAMFFIY